MEYLRKFNQINESVNDIDREKLKSWVGSMNQYVGTANWQDSDRVMTEIENRVSSLTLSEIEFLSNTPDTNFHIIEADEVYDTLYDESIRLKDKMSDDETREHDLESALRNFCQKHIDAIYDNSIDREGEFTFGDDKVIYNIIIEKAKS